MQQNQVLLKAVRALFLSCMLCILFAQIKTPVLYYDEGFSVFNATRIMNGDVPYKDFWTIYPPGQFYVLAVIFKIFGTNLLVARIYGTMVRFVIVLVSYWIVKKLSSQPLALLVCFVITLLLTFADSYTYAVFPALALSLLSILSLLQFTITDQRRWILLAGILSGVTTIFRWDIGLYTSTSLGLTILFSYYLHKALEGEPNIIPWYTLSQLLIALFGSTLFMVLLCYGYFAYRCGLNNVWSQVIIFPTFELRHVRWLPYPPIIPSSNPFTSNIVAFVATNSEFSHWLQFYCPLVLYGIAFSDFSLSLLKKRILLNTQFFGTTALLLLGVLFFALGLSRYDYIHVLPSSIIAFLIVIPIIRRAVHRIHNFVIQYYLITAFVVLLIIYLLFPLRRLLITLKTYSPFGCYSHVERAGGVYISTDQEQAIEFIRLHTQNDESIFVGNFRHDLISVNDIGFYFLSNRLCATRYHELHPGMATTRIVQEAIVDDMKSKKVTWLVLMDMPESSEPNDSALSSGVYFLDDFIRSTYVPIQRFGNYEIWKKIAM